MVRPREGEFRDSMRVILLNQPFHPDVVSTAQMAKDLADALVARGHEVTAVASRSIYGKTGAALPRRESIDGISVHRVGVNLFGRRGYLARFVDFGLFYALALVRVLTLPRPDVVISFTTPPMIALVGLINRVLRGGRAVYWVMDLYPDVQVACGMFRPRAPIVRILERISRFILRRSDAVVVLGRCTRKRLLDKGIDGAHVHLIPVWPIEADIRPIEPGANALRAAWNLAPDHIAVMYSGNFGIAHEAQTICGAMERLRNNPRIRFEFIGGGKRRPEVEAFIAQRNITSATYRDYVDRDRLSESLSAGDIHLVSIREGLEGLIVPSKIYGVMAAARPVIYVGHPDTEVAAVVRESGCGVLIREGDDAALARAIENLAADPAARRRMGQAGLEALRGRYDKQTACGAWADLLESLAGPAPAASPRQETTP